MSSGNLSAMSDAVRLASFLETAGFSPSVAEAKAAMFVRNIAVLAEMEGSTGEAKAYYVPGRIEVLGKHTDYMGGSTFIAALERAICMVSAPRDDKVISILDTAKDRDAEFEIDADLAPEVGHWTNFPMTVARRLARNFPGALRGANVVFSSDLPSAAGISSSSAIIIGFFSALADANKIWDDERFPKDLLNPSALSGFMGSVENGQSYGPLTGDRGVGTFGGSADHTAILCSKPGHVLQYTYCPVRFRKAFRMPPDHLFVVASSGVVAKKTGSALSKYNRASGLARRVTELWCGATGRSDETIAAALASGPEARSRLREIVAAALPSEPDGEALQSRLEHFLIENEEVLPAAGMALEKGDLVDFGLWVDRSQKAAEQLLGNQVPETVFLAKTARELGAVAASAFGAGFGGSVWALVDLRRTGVFLEQWRDTYLKAYPERAEHAEFMATACGRAMFDFTPKAP
jgi:galactokinase